MITVLQTSTKTLIGSLTMEANDNGQETKKTNEANEANDGSEET
jgi:hypothetical protein